MEIPNRKFAVVCLAALVVMFIFGCQRSSGVGEDADDTGIGDDSSTSSANDSDKDTGIGTGAAGTDSAPDTTIVESTPTDSLTDSAVGTAKETDSFRDTGSSLDSVSAVDTETETMLSDCGNGCVEIEWVPISGGTFEMGSEEGTVIERPAHTVTVQDFEMTRAEITVWQYAQCVAANVCSPPVPGYLIDNFIGAEDDNWGSPGYENHPVNQVDWNDAFAFCQWSLGRLPSETEWEYAARNGSDSIYFNASCDNTVVKGSDDEGCNTGRTMAVCSKPGSNTVHGLCDMMGNVSEWVQDTYWSNYEEAPSDGSARVESGIKSHVLRGAAYKTKAGEIRLTERFGEVDLARYPILGFRCAR